MISNKKIGTAFEKFVVNDLQGQGYWVHFLSPDERGTQPFDVIAVRNGKAYAIECKTLSARQNYFSISRLEENQKLAFEKWIACGNTMPIVAVEHRNKVSYIPYDMLKSQGKVKL